MLLIAYPHLHFKKPNGKWNWQLKNAPWPQSAQLTLPVLSYLLLCLLFSQSPSLRYKFPWKGKVLVNKAFTVLLSFISKLLLHQLRPQFVLRNCHYLFWSGRTLLNSIKTLLFPRPSDFTNILKKCNENCYLPGVQFTSKYRQLH